MTTIQDMFDQVKADLSIKGTTFDAQILNAIHAALRSLRGSQYWFLEASDTLTLPASASSVALPSDFASPDEFEIIVSGCRYGDKTGFDYLASFQDLKKRYWTTSPVTTGTPQACAIYSNTLYVSHIADASYSIPITYYKKDATLPSLASTSVWLDDGYDVLRSMAQFNFKRDSQHYTTSEEDGQMVAYYRKSLDDAQRKRMGGR